MTAHSSHEQRHPLTRPSEVTPPEWQILMGLLLFGFAGMIFMWSPLELPRQEALTDMAGTVKAATRSCGRGHNCWVTYEIRSPQGEVEISQEEQAFGGRRAPLPEAGTQIVARTTPRGGVATLGYLFWELSIAGRQVLSYEQAVDGVTRHHRIKRRYGYAFIVGGIGLIVLGAWTLRSQRAVDHA